MGDYIDATWYKNSNIYRLVFAGPIKQDIGSNIRISLFQLPFTATAYKMISIASEAIAFLLIEGGMVNMLSYSNLVGGSTWIYMDETFLV